jgi:replicative DNA helicase
MSVLDDVLQDVNVEVKSLFDEIDNIHKKLEIPISFIETGISDFDEKVRGVYGFTILGGEPATGKSPFTLQCATNAIFKNKIPCIILAWEMNISNTYLRLLQTQCKNEKFLFDFKETVMNFKEVSESFTKFAKENIKVKSLLSNTYIFDLGSYAKRLGNDKGDIRYLDFEKLKELIALIKSKHKTNNVLLIVDSLHTTPTHPDLQDKQRIDYLVQNFRELTDSAKCTSLVIAHQSRTGQATQNLNSFLGSASIEYNADLCLSLAHPKDNKGNIKNKDLREITVLKDRFGGKENWDCSFDYVDMSFYND